MDGGAEGDDFHAGRGCTVSGLIGTGLKVLAEGGNVASAASAAGRLAQLGSDIASGHVPASLLNGLGPWADGLQTATWRSLPFCVRESRIRRGRRVAVHEYPYKDVVWVEDLGRGTRSISFSGFLIGDDVYAQRDAFSTACDIPGFGELVHPSLGAINVVATEFTAGEAARRGRVVEIELTFIETGQDVVLYPTTNTSTQANSLQQAVQADLAAVADFAAKAASALALGATVLSNAVATAVAWARLAQSAIGDAELIANAVSGIPGIFGGRYSSGNAVASQPTGTTATTAIAAVTAARTTAGADIATMASATATTLPTIPQTIVADVIATAQSPADQIRLLAVLAGYQPTVTASTAAIGGAIATAQTATGAACRRAALAGLAQAEAAYQPVSYDDAMAVLDLITAVMDAEIVVAADLGDDASYLALRALRAAVADDLITRGADLPRVVTVTRGRSLPSLVLAYQLYGDATRSDDLIARVDPPAPLWMPTAFQALSA